jgi:hypothetical protein
MNVQAAIELAASLTSGLEEYGRQATPPLLAAAALGRYD